MAINWKAIEEFVGYGRLDAPVVFLGIEEGLQRNADLESGLLTRSTYATTMDLALAQGALDGPGTYFGEDAKTQNTWRPMCHVMLKMAGISHPTLQQRVRYQADRLGRFDGDSLVVELLPYPHSDNGQWLYSKFGRFDTREEYEKQMTGVRSVMIAEMLSKHPRKLIVAHGKKNWPLYKKIFGNLAWESQGVFEHAQWRDARVVLTHGLSSKQFNTDEQLDAFAAIAIDGSFTFSKSLNGEVYQDKSAKSKGEPIRRSQVGTEFLAAFGSLVKSYRAASELTRDQVSDLAKPFAGQGNPTGVRDLEKGNNWVNPLFAQGVFAAVEIPDADKLGAAYKVLKDIAKGPR